MMAHSFNNSKIASSLQRAAISIDFDNLIAHCDFLLKGLASESERFEKLVEDESKNINDDGNENYVEWLADDLWRLNDVFPSIQAASVFLLAYGMFEKNLNEIARTAGSGIGIKLKMNDLNGQGIERAKNYLSKVCEVTEPFKSLEWQMIKNFAKLRNLIAHASGELDLSKAEHKQILQYCRKQEKIKLKNYSPECEFAEVELSMAYVIDTIKCLRKFLIDLCNFKINFENRRRQV